MRTINVKDRFQESMLRIRAKDERGMRMQRIDAKDPCEGLMRRIGAKDDGAKDDARMMVPRMMQG